MWGGGRLYTYRYTVTSSARADELKEKNDDNDDE